MTTNRLSGREEEDRDGEREGGNEEEGDERGAIIIMGYRLES